MKIKTGITKAIEGGWYSNDLPTYGDGKTHLDGMDLKDELKKLSIHKILLDPKFWQALGKSDVWDKTHDMSCDSFNDYCTHPDGKCNCEECDCSLLNEWKLRQIQFIEMTQQGQSLEEAFDNTTK